MTVTVPGTSPGAPVTLPSGAGDSSDLAAQIAALLATIQGAGSLNVSTTSGDPPPVPATDRTQVLELFGSAVDVSVPNGYNYVVNDSSAAATVTGNYTVILSGNNGGLFAITGNSTLAATGGPNTVSASGDYLIATGNGSSVVYANGTGTIATGTGTGIVVTNTTAGGDV